MEEKVLVENIKQSDIEEIVQLGLSTKELWVEKDKPEYYKASTLRRFINSKADIHLAARANGNLVGYLFCIFNIYLREAYLVDLVVKKSYRGKGVGSQLVAEMMRRLKKKRVSWIWTLVNEDNKRMMKFISRKGLKQGRKFYFYYKTGISIV